MNFITKGYYLLLICLVTAEVQKEYRLPQTVVPFQYILRIHIDNVQSRGFTGSVIINFKTTEENNIILLHASPEYLNLTKIILNGEFKNPCQVTQTDIDTEIVTINCKNKTTVLDENSLSINYDAFFTEDDQFGLYKSRYVENGIEEIVLATQLAPSYARRVFPCFDEPSFRAAFDIFITYPESYQALANTPSISEAHQLDGFISTEFSHIPSIPTYLVGFVISKFERANDNVEYSVYTRPELREFTGIISRYAPYLVKQMENWTGIRFELMDNAQLFQVAVEFLKFDAVENWGLILYREKYILDEASKTTELSKQNIISRMAKAISQQWFGYYVTFDWWSNAWLSKGFATYFEYYLPDQIDGLNLETEKQFTVNVLQPSLREDVLPDIAPLSRIKEDVLTSDDYLSEFNDVTYNKGASLIRMMNSIVGEKKFQDCLKSYLVKNKLNSTNPSILLDSLELSNKLENWIYKPGFPLLTVKQRDGDQVSVTQEEFRAVENEEDISKTSWSVPVTFTTSKDKNFDVGKITWLEEGKELNIDLNSNHWIILNLQQTGFYRVNYDESLWNRIIDALKGDDKDNIHVLNRAQLIDDVFNIARVGKVSYLTAFRLAEYLKDEKEYYPWVSALTAISYLMDHINDKETLTLLRTKTLYWINHAFPNLEKVVATTHVDILKETLILRWKCKLQNEVCLKYVEESYRDYKKSQSISNFNEKNTIFCHGVRNSSNPQDEYSFLMHIFEDAVSPLEREDLLLSLGCISDAKVLSTYLLEIIADRSIIPRSYAPVVFKAVYSNSEIGVDVALEFLEKNFKQLTKTYNGTFSLSDFITGLDEKIKTEEQLSKFEKIVDDNAESEDSKKAGHRAISRIRYHLEWSKLYTEAIKTALPQSSVSLAIDSNSLGCIFSLIVTCIHFVLIK